jgi:hypothetical protein
LGHYSRKLILNLNVRITSSFYQQGLIRKSMRSGLAGKNSTSSRVPQPPIIGSWHRAKRYYTPFVNNDRCLIRYSSLCRPSPVKCVPPGPAGLDADDERRVSHFAGHCLHRDNASTRRRRYTIGIIRSVTEARYGAPLRPRVCREMVWAQGVAKLGCDRLTDRSFVADENWPVRR